MTQGRISETASRVIVIGIIALAHRRFSSAPDAWPADRAADRAA